MAVFRTFKIDETPGSQVDTMIVTARGCDGINHATDVCEIQVDEDGASVGGIHLRSHVTGTCDGTCKGRPYLGGFLIN